MAAILVVDDEPIIRVLLGKLLTDAGHAVHEAADGTEGLRALERGPFDLLLCDLFMPEKDGLEVIREVRRRQLSMRIIAMSGGSYGGRLDVLPLAECLGVTVIRKPFRLPDLLALVEATLNPERATPAASAEVAPDAGSRATGR
jgi:CheY-like chemotaxis protein